MTKTLAAAVAAGATGVLVLGSTSPGCGDSASPGAALPLRGRDSRVGAAIAHLRRPSGRRSSGQVHVPPAYTVQYPRDLAPLVGDTTLDDSVDEGVKEAVASVPASRRRGGASTSSASARVRWSWARTKRELIDAEGASTRRGSTSSPMAIPPTPTAVLSRSSTGSTSTCRDSSR